MMAATCAPALALRSDVEAERSAARTIRIAREHLIGRLGLIQDVREILRAPGDALIFGASCIASKSSVWLGADIEGHSGAVGFTWEDACAKAIGECVERYCCASYHWDELVFASKEELGDGAVGMDDMQIFAYEQYESLDFPFPRWDPRQRIHWTSGESLLTGEERHVPSALVYIPYRPRSRNDTFDMVGLSVSSGQACHTDRTKALLSGIYEVVERDAFMIRWLRQLPPVRVDFKASPVVADLFDRHFRGSHLSFEVFDITLDVGIPTMLALATGRSKRGPIVAVGAASSLVEHRAIIKALQECYQGMVWARDLLIRKPDWKPGRDYGNVRDFEDHVRLYCDPDMHQFLDFIVGAKESRKTVEGAGFASAADELDRALEVVEGGGLDVVAVNTTSPEIEAIGFHCPKIFIPGMVPLTAVHSIPALGAERLRTAPAKVGFQVDDDAGFNIVPHPFP